MDKARVPLERMLEMAGRTVGQGDVGRPILSSDQGEAVVPVRD
jgi:quinolinate synthase